MHPFGRISGSSNEMWPAVKRRRSYEQMWAPRNVIEGNRCVRSVIQWKEGKRLEIPMGNVCLAVDVCFTEAEIVRKVINVRRRE